MNPDQVVSLTKVRDQLDELLPTLRSHVTAFEDSGDEETADLLADAVQALEDSVACIEEAADL